MYVSTISNKERNIFARCAWATLGKEPVAIGYTASARSDPLLPVHMRAHRYN